MSTAMAMFFCIFAGVMLDVGCPTLRNDLNDLEQNVEWLKRKLNNTSEQLEQKIDTVDNKVDTFQQSLMHLNRKASNSEMKISSIRNQLEYGGKKFEAYGYNSKYVHGYN